MPKCSSAIYVCYYLLLCSGVWGDKICCSMNSKRESVREEATYPISNTFRTSNSCYGEPKIVIYCLHVQTFLLTYLIKFKAKTIN